MRVSQSPNTLPTSPIIAAGADYPAKFSTKVHYLSVLEYYLQGISGGFAARRPVGTFWYFSKSDSKSGTVHAGVDAVEQARTCAGSSAAMLQEFESWLYSKI